jgi:creatinine amidohydrolase
MVAETLAASLAARRSKVVVAPSLAVTASGEHAGFAGTLSLGTEVMTGVLVELVRSADWSAGVVLVNGHGGNRDAVARAAAVLAAEGREVLTWWPDVPGADAHAGRTETSLVLAIGSQLVREGRAETGATESLAELAPRLRAEGVRAVSPNGVLGDPTGATESEGRVLLDGLCDQLAAAVDAWLLDRTPP